MPGTRRYPPDRIRYATYIWPADWQPEATATSTSTSTSITSSNHYDLQQQQQQQQQENYTCCIRPSSYYYVPPSPEAFQRHRFVLSRCEQLDPSLLHRHGYSQLISDATSVVLWAIWTHLVYDADLVYMSVDYFCWLVDWLLWRVYGSKTVPNEPFPFASHPPIKTGPPYSDVVQYFLCRGSACDDGSQCLGGIYATNAYMNCSSNSSRYHTRWKMQQAIRDIFNGRNMDYYVGYGGNSNCHVCGGPGVNLTMRVHTNMPLVVSNCACLLPWPVCEPAVVVRVEERIEWKKTKKKSKESGCLVM
ncbi:hypothetical protein GE21DRAFT_1203648 [Neurospora crassa]|nr:hypothetical protein GE21DRAFT_1203648 [Neurospora crassa]